MLRAKYNYDKTATKQQTLRVELFNIYIYIVAVKIYISNSALNDVIDL